MTAVASFSGVANFGMTYDAARDRFWIADDGARLLQVDPNAGYAVTFVGFLPTGHTCIAAIPE